MIHQRSISASISITLISLLTACLPSVGWAQRNKPVKPAKGAAAKVAAKDSVALFRGFAVSVDLIGPLQLMVSDYGQYEAAVRLNLKDKYFPIVELGYGKGEHDDGVTFLHYKTSAPYVKIGIDFNVLKNKHDIYRLYAGARYAFTSFKYDLYHPDITDPVWGGTAHYEARDIKSNYHWFEAVFGVDAKIWGPVHLGWSIRYRSRLSYKQSTYGDPWYVPGFGKSDSSNLGGTFNVSLDI